MQLKQRHSLTKGLVLYKALNLLPLGESRAKRHWGETPTRAALCLAGGSESRNLSLQPSCHEASQRENTPEDLGVTGTPKDKMGLSEQAAALP